MKKVFSLVILLLCALGTYAVSYASPYKGAGRGGYIYTTSAVHQRAASAGMAQAPVAAMGSTGISMGSGAATSETAAAPQVRGIYTSASNIVGGVTSAETYATFGAPRKSPGHPGECSHCIDENDDGYCDRCGMDIYECDEETCWCPLDLNWAVMLFLSLLAGAYSVYKKRTYTLR